MKRAQAAAAVRTVYVQAAQQPAVIDWSLCAKKYFCLMSDVRLTYTKQIIYAIILFSSLLIDNFVVIIILARLISVRL